MRIHGKKTLERIVEFGEKILWYCPTKRRATLEPRWRYGVFLGLSWNTDANFLGLMDGTVVRARAMVRVIPSQRWDVERLRRVTGTPMSLNTAIFDSVEDATDPHRGPAGHRQDDADREDLDVLSRCAPILLRDLRTHGVSPDHGVACRR